MAYTVKKLAEISGVSVRTLHFYDEVGLLAPAYVGDNGYRYYEEEQLLVLQQILFFRELGFELKEIERILNQSDFDKVEALKIHKQVLQQKKKRMQELILTVDKTIERLKGDRKMTDREMYQGFNQEKQAEYEQYLVSSGKTTQDQIDESYRRVKHYKKSDWDKVKAEGDGLHRELVKAIKDGFKTDSQEVQSLIRKHYVWIQRFWQPDQASYTGLGQLYLEHPDFRKLFDGYHPKLAEFLADAMSVFAKTQLK